MQVKNYVYISDTKVDLFYDQIASSGLKKTARDYGIDIKFLKVTFKRETEKVLTQMQKLHRVVEFIQQSKKIGTVDKPSTCFTGTLNMRWGSAYGEMAFFVGETTRTGVALGGSLKHVIGVTPDGRVPPTSALPAIFAVFEKYTDAELPHEEPNLDLPETSPEIDLERAWRFAERFRSPAQKLEFLATNYLFGPVAMKKKTSLSVPPFTLPWPIDHGQNKSLRPPPEASSPQPRLLRRRMRQPLGDHRRLEPAVLAVRAEADDPVLLLYLARVYVFHLLACVLLGRELGRAVIVDDPLHRRAVIAHRDRGMLLSGADDRAFHAVLLSGRRRLPFFLLILRHRGERERERTEQCERQKNQFPHVSTSWT